MATMIHMMVKQYHVIVDTIDYIAHFLNVGTEPLFNTLSLVAAD
jgi:hypothetical protein